MASLQKVIKLLCQNGQVDREHLNLACTILNKSGVIALPTDTLYGLAAKASDSVALEKIYKIKDRDEAKPLAICVGDVEQISQVAYIEKININLLRTLLPGPITIILKRSKELNKNLNPSVDTVGIRVPSHEFVQTLCNRLGPLALTSANKSGEKSSLVINEFSEIWDQLDCIFDIGPIKDNVIPESQIFSPQCAGSTVVDLSDEKKKCYKIIRAGCALNRTVNILTRFGYIGIK